MKIKMLILAAALLAGMTAWSMEVAKVNGKPVTDKDVAAALSNLNEGMRANVLKDPQSRRQVLGNVIEQELLIQEAEKEKLDQDAEYKDALAQFRRQFLSNRILSRNLASKVTAASAKKFYDKNKIRYTTDEVHAQHILVSDEQEAVTLLKQAKSGGDFQALAEKYSKDPSAKNNRGDVGFFTRDRMVPEFTNAAFAAKDGEIVGPVKTSYGYHIIKVLEHKVGKQLSYDEVESRVMNDMKQELITGYVNKLRDESKIQIDDKALEKM
jgi:peptidyl-prolyl cis-trans isomerase C